MNENTKTDLGEIKIHKNVIASIAKEATEQIPGVLRIGGNIKGRIFELFGQRDNSAIRIEFDPNNEATISVPIVVQYGYNIPEIAAKIQESIKISIENATNSEIKDINVVVQEIEKRSKD
ncbi:Asp23/Gls24 family envelope stress response protein [Thermoproteota archaeon]